MGRCFIIAEAGVNHNGSLAFAKALVDIAVSAGADAVKFQTFKAERMVSVAAPKAEYQRETTEVSESQRDMLEKLELTPAAHEELAVYCAHKGIEFLSTPFDLESLSLLTDDLHLPRIKMASGEITNAPLLLKAARTGKPVILSTGMSLLGEVETALGVLAFGYIFSSKEPSLAQFREAYLSSEGQDALQRFVTLLHCTTEYPAPYSEVNLRVMDTLYQAFGLPVGLSDHTPGIAVPIAAVARGASVIEKHLTIDKGLPGRDHQASLAPTELQAMVQAIRQVEEALGRGVKIPTTTERKNQMIARKSLVAAREVHQGEMWQEDSLTTKRPGSGLSPIYYWDVLGTAAKKTYHADEILE